MDRNRVYDRDYFLSVVNKLKGLAPEITFKLDEYVSAYDNGDEHGKLYAFLDVEKFDKNVVPTPTTYDTSSSDIFASLNINFDLLNLRPYSQSTAKSYFDKVYDERKRIEKLSLDFISNNNLQKSAYKQELNNIIYRFTQKCVDISTEFDVRTKKLEWFI